MSEILLLLHAQGHTPGVAARADRIAAAGTPSMRPICTTAAH